MDTVGNCQKSGISQGGNVALEGPRVAAQVEARGFETGRIGSVNVQAIVHIVGQARGITEILVPALSALHRVGEIQGRADELQRSEREERIYRRIGIVCVGECLRLRLNLRELRRV